ncbi:hypothetical protein BDZ89DRAFT_1064365 [Hymenopellis radicata]|nr:hypothetical protein BDZ89DRAFT_1064365 [Hymenopellis radicata]
MAAVAPTEGLAVVVQQNRQCGHEERATVGRGTMVDGADVAVRGREGYYVNQWEQVILSRDQVATSRLQ